MSDVAALLEKADWVEELQKKVFEESAVQISESLSIKDSLDVDVPISVIINNVHRSFAQIPLFRQRSDFLEDLRKSLCEAGRNDYVDWYEFKKSSKHWFFSLVNLIQQDGNNNIRISHSDGPIEDSERDGCSIEEQSGIDANDDDLNSHSINQLDTIESCYSLNSSNMGFGMTDSITDSSDETHHPNGDIGVVDLEVRIRRYNEETASLRDELVKAEETVFNLERELKITKTALERMTNKFNEMKKENDDQKELLDEAERQSNLCKQHLRKLEKAQIAIEEKSRDLEIQKENIANLKSRMDAIVKENSEYAKKLTECRVKYDEKIIEYEYLQEKYNELDKKNCKLEKSFEINIQHHKEKIEELQNQCAELQSKMNGSDTSSRLSLTPPPYSQALIHVHSTPYNYKLRSKDSLFNELKASGYNIDEVKVQNLKQELLFYNEEIASIAEQVDEALQEIATSRNEICVPNMQLIESDSIQILKQKISTLINLVKSCTSTPTAQQLGNESPCQKPDTLLEPKKTSKLADDHVFAEENRKNNLIGSVTSTIPSITLNKLSSSSSSLDASVLPDDSQSFEQEVIIPIDQALSRINDLKEVDEEAFEQKFKLHSRISKPRPKFALSRNPNYSSMKETCSEPTELVSDEENSNLKANADVYAMGDGPHIDLIRKNNLNKTNLQVIDTTTNIKLRDSEFLDYKASSNETFQKLNTKYVTIRATEETYVLDGVVSSTVEKFELGKFKPIDMKPEAMYYPTPTKLAPRRKLSVYHRSFDIDSLQTPDVLQSGEKRRSISTPDVQESEFPGFKSKALPSFDASVTKSQLLNTYRCINTSDSSNSPSPTKKSSTRDNEDDSYTDDLKKQPVKIKKPLILAPTKFKLPDSTVNQTILLQQETGKSTPSKRLTRTHSDKYEAHQSRILSGSLDIVKRQLSAGRCNFTVDKSNSSDDSGSKLSTEESNSFLTADITSTENSIDYLNNSDDVYIYNAENHKNCTKADEKGSRKSETKNATASASIVNDVGDCSIGGGVSAEQSSSVSAVKLVMSSGEDSSAESECDPRQAAAAKAVATQPLLSPAVAVDADKKSLTSAVRPRSNSCVETVNCNDNKAHPVINGDDKENSYQKITSNSLPQEITKLDESPKAFPSLTDQKLREAGISNFNDIETEIKESLSEEELKKKYTAFSVGLGADRMTLSKRITLSRRFRDQDEKNLQMEVSKMEKSIKDLAPLCIDSESVAKVEQAKQDLEMISRCASRISRSAETLGAVQEERRVSRAVLLVDKYLQTLRAKCEKLTAELVETKRILAENNIMLEENVSEIGDDVPKVRYRAVLSNNRTMMARRRASIATISRPLMGSNQDISKEPPRQRNSVSGRMPSLRRPSLSYDPRFEIEKLDRTDSSNSITELREIHEQAESRRHSREENNNSIRVYSNNLALIPYESVDDQVGLSNTQDEMVPDLEINNDINLPLSLEILQNHRHPLVNRLLSMIAAWKPMLCGIFVAFFIGFFCNRVISTSKTSDVPNSWWSIEEILNQYTQVDNTKNTIPRPV
ncbi:uncharacterized protein LOC131663213 isoform X3 [Phymastichus coffea]|uniref:uncharacterized protein LOC131663213 isoform X3 n=1 Tax=Phymastichus coffea TaxID=108790 RepID=UPI00273CB252|nr:uncharacterized protein LOC131663213 isoform X3 [Phymastichus coffea]